MNIGAMAAALVAGVLLWGEAAAERSAESIVRDSCAKCHGMKGQSSDPTYPKLAGQNADYLTRQLANFRTGVRTGEEMPTRVANLTGGEMRALALYFSSQTLTPEVAYDPALAEAGRALYFAGNPDSGVTACVSCHGPDGRGAMYLPRVAGQHARYIRKQIHAFLDQSRSSPDMVMHKVVENITEAEIEAVAQFLSGLD